ncbi:MAG: hypothetical protein PHD83_03660 [Caldisericia bacterium]|nr:hypothetical protein [Caldisericia bacterium]
MSPIFSTVTVMENFTATWLNRRYVSEAIHELHEEHTRDQLVVIRYYVDSTSSDPIPKLSCEESETRMKWYMSDKGLPTTFFNGTVYLKGGAPHPGDDTEEGAKKAYKQACDNKISEINTRIPPVSIAASCKKNEIKDEYTLDVLVRATDTLSYSSLLLNIALVENNIPYSSLEKVHYCVFREWIKPSDQKDTIGIPLSLKESGDQFKAQFTYLLNSELYKNDLSIILFVQDMETKAILQGFEIKPS